MKKAKLLLVAIAMVACYSLSAQMAVTTDGNSADASAMLEVKSSDKGFLPPRLTATEIGNIASPANGLFVFNTTDNKAYIFVSADNEWKEVSYGTGTISPPPFIDDRDSKSYTTVQIGTQCWMAENLAYLPAVIGPGTSSETVPYYYVYDYNGTDITAAKATANYTTYGVLYNWPAAMNGASSSAANPSGVQGICPTGWHLPSDAEWKILEGNTDTQYGVGDPAWDGVGYRGYDAGKRLKTTTGWNSNTGTNAVGFSALPGGYLYNSFRDLSNYGNWWSSTDDSDVVGPWYRDLKCDLDGVNRLNNMPNLTGFRVRCLKD